ncbi:M1 family metallopeptidase [Robbsia sp. Bb-Pol-6]|uniref:Aminopeptidase n=1 Tax=Robbsia betulipollinis TaxID=2981849 RepID=A0ABT3ZKN1_9BURK|nr:M1 family metallopeptidase [Robbsia betulipollinis]MCY0387012.1 M1 family metallopeptidase [Robbsia betulipollinis]
MTAVDTSRCKPSFPLSSRTRFIGAALLTLAAQAAGAATPDDSPPLGQLPDWAAPLSYKLDFRIDPHAARFDGTTTIALDLRRPADHLWLHASKLDVHSATLTDAAGKRTAVTLTNANASQGVAEVHFPRLMPAGRFTLRFAYSAPLEKGLDGLYRVDFAGHSYAMTQMESISARNVFPSFDEPRFKTPYTLTIAAPARERIIANTPEIAERAPQTGWREVTFAPTRPLPTYLVAFAVGPWDLVRGPTIAPSPWRSAPIPLQGVTTAGEGARIDHILGETPAIIASLENYFAFGYPFGKIALLAAPDFSAGAMENPGLVTFRDFLLLSDANTPKGLLRDSFVTVAHELSHQWNGDTVTMAWWDDLWLNEAFATWMQSKITEQVHPEYRIALDDMAGTARAMSEDSLAAARQIRQPITDNSDIDSAFDGITYQKGAAVLRMFEKLAGETPFRDGVRQYLKAHAFSTAGAADLISAIQAQTPYGERYGAAFRSFIDQPGVPLLTTRLVTRDGQVMLNVTQQRYLPLGSNADARRVWGLPVCVRYGVGDASGTTSKTKCELVSDAQGSIVLDGANASSWYMPNADAAGYYQFEQADDDRHRLHDHLAALSDLEKLAYARAIAAGFQRGDLPSAVVLETAAALAASPTRQVSTALMGSASWLYLHAAGDAQRAHVRDVAIQAWMPAMTRLGYAARPQDSEDDALLRATLLGFFALDLKVPEVRQALLAQSDPAFAHPVDGHPDLAALDANTRDVVLAVAVQERGDAAITPLADALGTVTDAAQRLSLLHALGAAVPSEHANRVMDLMLDPRVKTGELAQLLRNTDAGPASNAAIWSWYTAHADAVAKRSDGWMTLRLPQLFGARGCTAEDAARVGAQFNGASVAPSAGLARSVRKVQEQIGSCAALVAKMTAE